MTLAGRGRCRLRGAVPVLAAVLLGCATTRFEFQIPPEGRATVTLTTGTKVRLEGPVTYRFRCTTWGDSYFQVLDWTCSGGQLSPQAADLAAQVAEAAIKAALASSGVGAAGSAASLLGGALEKRAAEDALGETISEEPAPQDPPEP